MKNFKKLLNDEFEAASPELSEEVKNAPIITGKEAFEIETAARYGNTVAAESKRKLYIGAAFIAVLIALVFAVLAATGTFNNGGVTIKTDYVFAYEINPAVAFVTDENGVVKNVSSLNKDADVVLSDEETADKIKNVPLETAVVTYTEAVAKLGYLDIKKSETKESLSAVRISFAESADKIISSVKSSLEGFFKSHGIFSAVVDDKVDVKELCSRVNVEYDEKGGLKALSDTLETENNTYYGKVNKNATEAEIKDLYENEIVGSDILDIVRGGLIENLNKIKKNAEMIKNIYDLNNEIMAHADNPIRFGKLAADFWTLKRLYGLDYDYSEEFSALMSETNLAVEEYKEYFNKELESSDDLEEAGNVYKNLGGVFGTGIEAILKNFTSEDFIVSPEKFISLLKLIGIEVTDIENIIKSVPTTVEKYIAEMKSAVSMLKTARYEKFSAVYEEARNEITTADYDEYINRIISSYGSLTNFWADTHKA